MLRTLPGTLDIFSGVDLSDPLVYKTGRLFQRRFCSRGSLVHIITTPMIDRC